MSWRAISAGRMGAGTTSRGQLIAPASSATISPRRCGRIRGAPRLSPRANPFAPPGEPDDVAGTAVLLASRAGSFHHRANSVVDGGGLIGGGEPLT